MLEKTLAASLEKHAASNLKIASMREMLAEAKHKLKGYKELDQFAVTMFAVGISAANCDGNIDPRERETIAACAGLLAAVLPEPLKSQIGRLYSVPPTVDELRPFIENLDPTQLPLLDKLIDAVIHADGIVHSNEHAFLEKWKNEISARAHTVSDSHNTFTPLIGAEVEKEAHSLKIAATGMSRPADALYESLRASRDAYYDLTVAKEPSKEAIAAELAQLRTQLDKEVYERFTASMTTMMVLKVATPLGLGFLLFRADREGGPVTTQHNADKGIFAKESEEYSKNISDYSNTLREKLLTKNSTDGDGTAIDGYTGQKANVARMDADHVIAKENYHNQGGYMKDREARQSFANDERNGVLTDSSLNRSKGAGSLEDEDTVLRLQKEHHLDPDRAAAALTRAKDASAQHLPTESERRHYLLVNGVESGITTGLKVGVQQVLGIILLEFGFATYRAVLDVLDSKTKESVSIREMIKAVQTAIRKSGRDIMNRWRQFLSTFMDGLFSGFISVMVTTLINHFVTTAKNIVRLIREGTFSLVQAVKVVFLRTNESSLETAIHEALKILLGGSAIAAGILLEEQLRAYFGGGELAGLLSVIISGLAAGLASVLAAFLVDKLDPFGAIAEREHETLITELESRIDRNYAAARKDMEEMGCGIMTPSLSTP